MRLLIALVLISISAPCFASFTGFYKGQGMASDEGGWEAPCSSLGVEIQDPIDQLVLNHLDFECGAISQHRSKLTLKRDQGHLKLGDEILGEISDQEIDFRFPSSIEGTDWIFRLRKSGEKIIYKEDWLARDGQNLEWVFGVSGELGK